ncbi:hypothetical protein A2U01_0039785 [Trifolium medium]|uniref:Retrotransposon gag domain-containing protein n=1 Tax=Trifolium medium TaxID=97028 RepID=A0A392Q4I1_9FABA|nr:hypothetical protein [Trifolium medium]
MFISGAEYALSCKIFAGTLKDVAHKWIARLPARSVTSFEDLATRFVAQFTANSEKPFLLADLFRGPIGDQHVNFEFFPKRFEIRIEISYRSSTLSESVNLLLKLGNTN